MPAFAPGDWLNVEQPLTKEQLRGRVTLVDFWDYTCINCIRTLPYVTSWDERYRQHGLTVIGVHAPEFRFARARAQIEDALREFDIEYPVLLDNDYQTWDRFAVRAWPTKFLIDADGYVRFRTQGEGGYRETEGAIQQAIAEIESEADLPRLMKPLCPEDETGAVCYRTTPELHTGFQRGSLGNRQGYAANNPVVYELPRPADRAEPWFYAGGIWQAGPEAFAFAGQNGGQIVVPYSAAGVNAVFSPSADPVEIALDLRDPAILPFIEVWLDGQPLTPDIAGADVEYDDGGLSIILVDRPRLYELVRTFGHESHELSLVFRAHGLALYAFTFERCVKSGAEG
jgi:thiol-disulfide isomerase/thioredoxin